MQLKNLHFSCFPVFGKTDYGKRKMKMFFHEIANEMNIEWKHEKKEALLQTDHNNVRVCSHYHTACILSGGFSGSEEYQTK